MRRGTYLAHDAIRLLGDVRVGWLRRQHVREGWYAKHGEDEGSGYYAPSAEGGGAIEPGWLGGSPLVLQAFPDGRRLCVVTSGNARVCTNDARYQHIQQSITFEGSFRQALAFTGRIGSRVQVEYREFRAGSTRPQHRERLEFDLRQRATIGYKGAEVEVVEAGDHSLTFRVLSNFSE